MACSLSDLEISQLFSNLEQLIIDVGDEAASLVNLEIDLSSKGVEDGLSQGFWDSLVQGDIDRLSDAIGQNPIFNPADVATTGLQFGSVLTSLFGGPAVVPELDPNTGARLSDKINSAFGSEFGSCDARVSAIGTVQGIIGIQAKKLKTAFSAAQATFGGLLGGNPEVGPAVFITGLKNYLVRSTAQNLLLEQIRDEINNINEEIEELTDSDYSINHKTVLSASIVELSTADNILRAQLDNVLQKFPLNMTGYDNAKARIETVQEALCGIDLDDIFGGFLSPGVLKLTARLIYLEELLELLRISDEASQRILLNLGSFDTAYEDITFFDDLFVPVLQLIRCRLAVVMADMQSSIDKNKLANFVLKEKAWCLELTILSSLMDAAKVFDIPRNEGPFAVEGIEDIMNSLFQDVQTANQIIAIDSIRDVADVYIQNVRYKLSFNVPVVPIQARGNLVNRLIEQRISENESFGLLVNSKVLSVEGTIFTAIGILGSFLTAVGNLDVFTGAAEQIADGDLKGLLNGSILNSTLAEQFEGIINDIGSSLEEAGCSLLEAGDKSLQAYDIFEDTTRAEALFNDSLAGFPETVLRESVQGDLTRYTSNSSPTP